MGFAKYREELEQKKKKAEKKTGFAAYREQRRVAPSVSLEDVKDTIGKIPETSTSLSAERARDEKIALKNPEKYAQAQEHLKKMQTDKQYAADYEAQRAAKEEWDKLLSTDVSSLEKELEALKASRPVYENKNASGAYDARGFARFQAEAVPKNMEIDKKVAELEKKIFEAKMAQAENTYSLIPKRSDFAQYSADEKHKGTNLYDSLFGRDPLSADNLNRVHRAEYDELIASGETEAAEQYLLMQLDNDVAPTIANAGSMTDEEKNTFRYILNKEGEDAAMEYLGFIQERVNARAAEANMQRFEDIKKNSKGIFKWLNEEAAPVVHSYFAGAGNIGVNGGAGVRNPISGAMAASKSQFLQSAMREDEDTGFLQGAMMDTASAVGMMTPSMIIGAFNPTLGKLAMSARIFSDSTNSSLKEGKSLGDSVVYGITNGAIEYVTSTFLGGIKNVSKRTLAKKLVPAIDKALAKTKKWIAVAGRALGNTVANVSSEAFEEWLQSSLDPIVRNVIFDENNEVNPFSSDALYEGLIGGLTALFLGGTPSASKQESINRILQETEKFSSDSVVEKRNDLVRRMHEDVNSITDTDLIDLYNSVAEEIMETASLENVESDTGARAIRDSLSRDAQDILDGVLAMDEVKDKDAAANIFEMNYLKGYLGRTFEADEANTVVSADTQRLAYELGIKAKASLGTVTVEKGAKVSEEFRTFLERLAKELHTHISIGGKAPVENGVQSRGYSTKYGELHIYEDAQVSFADGTTLFGEDAARVIILGHELTHRLQQLAPEEYEKFCGFAVQKLSGRYGIAQYQAEGGYTPGRARDEMAANYAMQYLFSDEKTIGYITEKHSKLAEVIRSIIAWVKGLFGNKSFSELTRAEKLWNRAYMASKESSASEDVHNKIAENNVEVKKSTEKKENFRRDKYFDRQIDKWNTLTASYIKAGRIKAESPLNRVGISVSDVYFDVSKIKKEMTTHEDHLSEKTLKGIPDLLNDPIVITEYQPGKNSKTVSVYGNLYTEKGTPVVVGVMVVKGNNGITVTKIRTIHADSHPSSGINDNSVLFLKENKKEIDAWFQARGINVPLDGTQLGVIRSIDFNNSIPNPDKIVKEKSTKESRSGLDELTERLHSEHKSIVEIEKSDKVRRNLSSRAKDDLAMLESTVTNSLLDMFSVPLKQFNTLRRDVMDIITREYLATGTVSKAAIDRMYKAAESLSIGEMVQLSEEQQRIRNYLRNTAITLSETEKSDISHMYDGYSNFHRAAMGLLKLRKEGGMSVDSVYSELQEMYPDMFPEILNTADQLNHIFTVATDIDNLRNSFEEIEDSEDFEIHKEEQFAELLSSYTDMIDVYGVKAEKGSEGLDMSEVYSFARSLVAEEEGRAADRKYTMSLDTFEQIARSYTAEVSEKTAATFAKKLYNAAVELAAATHSRGIAKEDHYRAAYLKMQEAARVLEKDKEVASELAGELVYAVLEAGYAGKATSQEVRDSFMTKAQIRQDTELRTGRKVHGLKEIELSEKLRRKDEQIEKLLKDKEALREKSERSMGGALRHYREKYSQWKEEYHENDTVHKRRERIEKNAAALYKWATKPDKKKMHSIPEAARVPVLEMLGRLNLIKGEEGRPPSKHDVLWGERLANIANALDSRKNLKNTPDMTDSFIPIGVIERLKLNANSISHADVYEMRGEELRALDESLCMLKHLILEANELHLEGRTVALDEAAEEEMKRLDGIKKSKTPRMVFDYMDSFTYAEEVGGLMGEITKDLRHCFDRFISATADVQDFTRKELGNKAFRKWSKNTHEVSFGARRVFMTETQIMSLYLLSKRKQAQEHIYGGGIQIEQKPLLDSSNAEAKKWASETKDEKFGEINKADVDAAIALLSTEQIKAADAIQKFMADVLGAMGNDVSMRMYGYLAFTEKDYFPIRMASGANATTASTENVDNIFAVMNSSMTKSTVEHAQNAILIEDIFSVFTNHASDMINYYAYAEAISNGMRAFNYKAESRNTNLDGKLNATYPGASDFFLNQIRSLNKQKAFGVTDTDKILRKAAGNVKASMVGANLRVVLQQPTAGFRAATLIDAKYFLKAGKPVSKELIYKYCPIAQWKAWGFYDLDIGHDLDTLLFGDKSIYDAVKDKQMWLAGKADEATWSALWNACEAEISDKRKDLKRGSEEFYQAVGNRLSQVVDETQVVDSPFHRVQAARSKGDLTKSGMSFTSEPMKNLNMLYRAKKRGGKILARTFLAVEVSQITAAMAAALIDALRDDDDEKDFLDKYFSAMGVNLIENVNPLSWIPFVGDGAASLSYLLLFGGIDKIFGTNLKSLVPKIYESERYETMLVYEVYDAFTKVLSDNFDWNDKLYYTLRVISFGSGVALSNLYRDTVGAVINLSNGVSPKGAYKKVLAAGNVEKAKENYEAFLDAKCEELAKSKYGKDYSQLTGTEKKKVRSSAASSIRTTTKALFEESYIKAWKKGDDEAITRIRGALIATDVYDMDDIKDFFASFVKSYYREQYKKAKSEFDKAKIIKEAANAKGRLIGDFKIFKNYAEAKKYFTE